ncbi:MAG: hypothetical protein L0Z70_13725 [Chloroflexi bacterium]|nr:hypothetical protein [Chloroflexota bacterium]
MIATLIAFPLMGVLMIIQAGVLSRIPLLYGTPDLLLLVILAWALQPRVQTAWQWCIIGAGLMSLVSALPPGTALVSYSLATALALTLRRQVWQAPILAMFIAVFGGTLISLSVSYLAVRLTGAPIPLGQAFNLVFTPSIFLNLALAAPAYALLGDLASWLYPEVLEV